MQAALNPSQRAAVRHIDGPLLVLAGAGSGKTRVIAAKIAHLIDGGVDPARIAAITFTNKAAREMRERTKAMLASSGHPQAAAAVSISTFHALGLSIIRGECAALGLPRSFSVFDPDDALPILSEVAGIADRGRARAVQWQVSQWKNALVAPAAALAGADSDDARRAARAYAQYGDALTAYRAVDFDDLIAKPIELFERDREARGRWQSRWAHMLIDEYQDTNPAQYRLFRALAGSSPFTAVGDDDQAIYGWRGATLDNLALLSRECPDLTVVKLEQNYRSTTRILRSANALIANNPKLFDKRLWSELGHGDALRVAPAKDEDAEAELVVARLCAHKFEHRTAFSDYAILYRGNHQARVFETALRARNVPYEVSGGQSMFERTEIKDVVAYLRLIANDSDDPAFVRAATTPKRGIGASTLERLSQTASSRGVALFEAAFDDAFRAAVPARQRDTLDAFCALINRLRHRAEREPAGRLLNELVTGIGYEDWLSSTLEKRDCEVRMQSVRDFVGWLARKGESDNRNLLELTQMIALVTRLDDRDVAGGDAVRLSTLHAAKGLEFAHVFLVGLEEGLLPHREAVDGGNVEEERRLMYVGLTRAQRSLHLSFCRTRKRAGERVDVLPSRFLKELAQEDLRYADAPLTAEEQVDEKARGAARLQALKQLVGRQGPPVT